MSSLKLGGRDLPSCLGDSKILETRDDLLLLVHHEDDLRSLEPDQGEDTDEDDPCLRREDGQGNIHTKRIISWNSDLKHTLLEL